MVNKPIPYSFDYSLSRESKNFKSGIKIKPYPYRFNHAVGLSHGSYRFRYDRRDKLHIEKQALRYIKSQSQIIIEDDETYYTSLKGTIDVDDSEVTYVSARNDINKENNESSYISSRGDIDIFNFKTLSMIELREVIKNKYKSLNITLKDMHRENKDYLVSSIVHELKKDTDGEYATETSRVDSSVDKECEYELIKPKDELYIRYKEYVLGKIKSIIEKENNFELSKDSDYIEIENNYILEKIDDLIIKDTDKHLSKDNDSLIKDGDIDLSKITSSLEHENNERNFITEQEVEKEKNRPPLIRRIGELNALDSSTLFYRLNEMIKDNYELTSFRDTSKLEKDSYELVSFKETNNLHKDNIQSLFFKNFLENVMKDSSEKSLLRNFIKDDLIKDVYEKRLYLENIKESMLEEIITLHRNIEGKEVDIYEESLWKRWHADIEKDIMKNEEFVVFIDGEINIDTKINILELIRNIDIHKSLNKIKMSASNRIIGKELNSKQLSKMPIGDIYKALNDTELEKIPLSEIIKEDNLINLTYQASKEIIKSIELRQLDVIAAKEIEVSLTNLFLDIKRIKELSREDADKLLSKDTTKEIFKDIFESELDVTRRKNIEVEDDGLKLDVKRIKDVEIDNTEIKLILERVMILEKDIKETLFIKNHAKEGLLDNFESLVTKNHFKDAHIETSERTVKALPYKDLDLNRFECYYRAIIPIIDKSEEFLIEKGITFIAKEIVDIVIERIEEDISLLLELQLEKVITELLEKDSLEKLLEKELHKLLEKDISENLLEKLITKLLFKDTNEVDMDALFDNDMEVDIQEFLLDRIRNDIEVYLEDEENELDKEAIKEIMEDLFDEEYLMDLVNEILLEINEESTLDPSAKDILTYIFKNLEKQEKEFVLDEDLPLVKVYKEINKGEPDIQVLREQSIVKETSVELSQKFRSIDKFEEKNLDLYKRFWFLRATDPLDWKIVPYDNFPYEDEPVIFDEDKEMIPDNWQLKMVGVENKLFNKIDKNPVPFGEDASNTEIALSIEIMIEMINILILLWSRLFYAFTGYTGTQSVTRLTRTLYEWLTLETSIGAMENKESKDHYMRAYRWIRWEAEKVAIKARDDMNLNGNFYIDEFVFELIYYMENHHFNTMPLFEVVEVMDEYRALIPSDEPQGDIEFVLDKVKGIRHKILDCREKRSNE